MKLVASASMMPDYNKKELTGKWKFDTIMHLPHTDSIMKQENCVFKSLGVSIVCIELLIRELNILFSS